jgi:hypothetical protein
MSLVYWVAMEPDSKFESNEWFSFYWKIRI